MKMLVRSLFVVVLLCMGAPAYAQSSTGVIYQNITTATTTTVKSTPGYIHTITINTQVASATITIYDNTAASGNKIGIITLPSAVTTSEPVTVTYDANFLVGLTIVTSGATDISVSYR